MSTSVEIDPMVFSIALLLRGIQQLQLACQELKELEDNCGTKHKIDFIIKDEAGEEIGVRAPANAPVEFVLKNHQSAQARKTLDKVKQAYSRLKVLDEVKRKGYSQVKEEKLANGSIRLVVQKWQ